MMKKGFLLLAAVLTGLAAQARERRCFDADWKFVLADSVQMSRVDYDDSWWRWVEVPHDWAVEGDFSAGNPCFILSS